jgi:hypothetical protein
MLRPVGVAGARYGEERLSAGRKAICISHGTKIKQVIPKRTTCTIIFFTVIF